MELTRWAENTRGDRSGLVGSEGAQQVDRRCDVGLKGILLEPGYLDKKGQARLDAVTRASRIILLILTDMCREDAKLS